MSCVSSNRKFEHGGIHIQAHGVRRKEAAELEGGEGRQLGIVTLHPPRGQVERTYGLSIHVIVDSR